MINTCPCCDAPGVARFYEAASIPVQSNLLAATRQEAIDVPLGDLRLASCAGCGFITNTAFDPASQQQTAKYEATQGCSATFNSFARGLAERWAAKYLKPGMTALEIGCLRGEFTQLLHEISGCPAIGLDPVLETASPAGSAVTLIPDYYSEKYAHLPADLIVCRHTLEHIPNAGAFVRTIRRAIGNRSHTTLAIEVPDTLRVLREGAFWDVYYEHCSYFTPGSLARLFRTAGFDLLDLRREYDDQYLILEANPSAGLTRARFNLEDDLASVADAVAGFPAASERQLARWRRVIDETFAEGKPLVLWGSGSKAVGFLSTLAVRDDRVPYVVDINPRKQNTFLPGTGQRIIGPEALREYHPDAVIVMNPVYVGEIRADLKQMGLTPELFALG